MKKITAIITLTVALLLAGCKSSTYQFPNKDQNIECVELLFNPYAQHTGRVMGFTLIRKLDYDEIEQFMNKIYDIETGKFIGDPPTNYGPYVARVTYESGNIEFFASWHLESVKKGDRPWGIGSYYFKGDAFDELFREYAGIEDFSEYTIPPEEIVE